MESTPHLADPRRPDIRRLVVFLVLLGCLRLAFPGDISFIADEPLIIDRALDANDAGTLVSAGLQGTRGARYGPAPTWFYQMALSMTSDLRWVAVARIALVTALTGLAIVILARTLEGLSPVLGAFAFLSPYLWFYSRDLWDNSFAIPLSALLFATYAAYHGTGRMSWLAWTAFFGLLSFLTHFMTAPLIGAVALHFLLTRWRTLVESRRFALGFAVILATCIVITVPYLVQVSGGALTGLRLSPSPRSLAFSLNGFRALSLVGFDYVIGPWSLGGVGPVARFVTLFSYGAGAYGFLLCLRAARSGETTSLGREVARVLLMALALFMLIANGKRLDEHPHYYNGIWIVFFCFWWIGMTRLLDHRWARRALCGQAAVMACFLIGLAWWLHVNEGTRSLHYGPTLEAQMAVARELDSLGVESAPPNRALPPGVFPHAIDVLRRLNRRGGGVVADVDRPLTGYEIVYTDPDGLGGGIRVRRVEANAPGPGGAPPP
jgi:hypothetical protein